MNNFLFHHHILVNHHSCSFNIFSYPSKIPFWVETLESAQRIQESIKGPYYDKFVSTYVLLAEGKQVFQWDVTLFLLLFTCLNNKLPLAAYQKTFWVLCCFYTSKTACMECTENQICLWKAAPHLLRLSCSTVLKFVLLLHLQPCCCLSLRTVPWWDREFHLKKK